MVIPVYNAEKYIEKCADSLLQQSYTELELLFVDDGSRDQSWQILKKRLRRTRELFCSISRTQEPPQPETGE